MKFMACVLGAVCTIPVNVVIENIAVIWGLFGKKHKFYVVQKDVRAMETVWAAGHIHTYIFMEHFFGLALLQAAM